MSEKVKKIMETLKKFGKALVSPKGIGAIVGALGALAISGADIADFFVQIGAMAAGMVVGGVGGQMLAYTIRLVWDKIKQKNKEKENQQQNQQTNTQDKSQQITQENTAAPVAQVQQTPVQPTVQVQQPATAAPVKQPEHQINPAVQNTMRSEGR